LLLESESREIHRERKALRARSFLVGTEVLTPYKALPCGRTVARNVARREILRRCGPQDDGEKQRQLQRQLRQSTAKEEAGPSPIRASRVWAQDETKKKSEGEDRPLTPKGRAPVKATATQPQNTGKSNCNTTATAKYKRNRNGNLHRQLQVQRHCNATSNCNCNCNC
jgi:hypothetical protein